METNKWTEKDNENLNFVRFGLLGFILAVYVIGLLTALSKPNWIIIILVTIIYILFIRYFIFMGYKKRLNKTLNEFEKIKRGN